MQAAGTLRVAVDVSVVVDIADTVTELVVVVETRTVTVAVVVKLTSGCIQPIGSASARGVMTRSTD